MKHALARLALVCLALSGLGSTLPAGGAELSYFLPRGVEYDPAIPTPEAVLGQEVGAWHLRHDQLVRYLRVLAEVSDRLTLEVQGHTHEGREQILLIATSPAHHGRLESLRAEHVALTDPTRPTPEAGALAAMPAVVLLGYSIHGNEASGSNASVLLAYHLAAARGAEIESLLDELVVLIDPSLNPDGMGRFAQWANGHRGVVPVADPESREHQEGWPNGRTNHYWFDLNRDWLLLQHPESRNRVATFHRWKPNLLGDYHEMGSDGTYFFQPGVPSRKNPLTPLENVRLTSAIAEFHAASFDEEGGLYYTEETFDDFYPGKGSTYPDLNGAVGVLFEQASVRGHRVNTEHGLREFSEAVRNHLRTSFSMLAGARARRLELLGYQDAFYRGAARAAAEDPVKGYVFSFPHDPARAHEVLELLLRHQIEVYQLAQELRPAGGETVFAPGEAYLVPLAQPQYRLARSLFERRKEFEDSTFYDISTWTLPLAMGARWAELGAGDFRRSLLGDSVGEPSASEGTVHAPPADASPYAYLIDPRGSYVGRALYSLLAEGRQAYVATLPFEARTGAGPRSFPYGTVVVPAKPGDRALRSRIERLAQRDGLEVFATDTGNTAGGIDLGSPSVHALTQPKPLLVVGNGVSPYEAGELWYLLDHHYRIEVSLIDLDRLAGLDLSEYTHVLMVSGDYRNVGEKLPGVLRRWVRAGGTLVTTQNASDWVLEQVMSDPDEPKEASKGKAGAGERPNGEAEKKDKPELRIGGYADYATERAKELVSGAILEARLDLSHPLAFGFQDEHLALFRTRATPMETGDNPYENVALYTAEPWLSGYISPRNVERLSKTAAVTAARLGQGAVIRLADDPFFRAYWHGPSRLILNALFYGPILDSSQPPSKWEE